MTQIMIDVSSDTVQWYQAEAAERGTTYLALIREVLEWLPVALAPKHQPEQHVGEEWL